MQLQVMIYFLSPYSKSFAWFNRNEVINVCWSEVLFDAVAFITVYHDQHTIGSYFSCMQMWYNFL